MADKLILYNTALMYLEEESLSSLTEVRDARFKLDLAWASARKQCLEKAFWKFALRTVQLDYSPSVTPSFGLRYAFRKPDDWIRTYQMSLDEYLKIPFNGFTEDNGYWFADTTPMYCKYVSSDAEYGYNMGRWPESFTEYVARHLVVRVAPSINGSSAGLADFVALEKKAFNHAAGVDAMNGPAGFIPFGSWVRSRGRTVTGQNYDRV